MWSRIRLHFLSAFALIVVWGGLVHRSYSQGASSPKWNVVFIMADDLGWGETSCYGQQRFTTPNIDRLAKEGMRFTHHYSGAPVCAPSRCVLLTGKHLGHAEIRGNKQAKLAFPEFAEGQHPISENVVTVAQRFQQHGYRTAAFGKWGLGPVGSSGDPGRKGFDRFFGYNCQAVAHSYYPSHLWSDQERVLINTTPIPGHAKRLEGELTASQWNAEQYAPDLMIAEAEKFIDEVHSQPFFLYLPFIEPHVAIHPPADRLDRFPADWDGEVYRGENGYLPHPRPRAAYATMITDLDSYVGRILTALDRHKIAEQTLVVFTSDNGTTHAGNDARFHVGGVDAKFFNSTRELRGYKGSLHEGGIRVPLLVRLPNRIPAGSVNSFPSYFADWFPTLEEAVGFESLGEHDGQSFWPTLQDPTRELNRKPMVWVFAEYGGQVAVRFDRIKVIRKGLLTKNPGPWEVYDIEADPSESKDLSASESSWIAKAIEVLRDEVDSNAEFPVPIPDLP